MTLEQSSGFFETNGGKLYYEVSGSGTPLLFLHAGIADSSMWDAQAEAFADYRVIRFDGRGFGRTTTEGVSYSNRQDIHDLLTHLGVEKAVIIGISRGGQIAVDFALEFPHMTLALVAVAAGLGGFMFDAITETERALYEQEEALAEAGDLEAIADFDVQLWVDGAGQPPGRAPEWLRQRVRTMTLHNNRRFVEQHPTPDSEPKAIPLAPPAAGRLGDIQVPTLVIVGDLDTSDTLAMADALATAIPNAERVDFPGVAHMINMEKPERFNRVVRGFLERLSP